MRIALLVENGGIYTTVEGLYRWDQNFFGSRIGGSPGYNAFILRFPERKFTVACLANYALNTTGQGQGRIGYSLSGGCP